MDDSKLLDEFLKKFSSVNNEINNNIYNEKFQKKPFILQYKQLISYFNFKKKLEKKLSVKQFPKEIKNQNEIKNKLSPNKTIINKYYLIDKKWIEKWKKHIGFNEIEKYCKENNIIRELNDKDYNWISQIIEKNYKENYLNSLDMSNIYKDNELDPFADFEIVDKNCYELFIKGSKNPKENKNYPIIIFKEKFILDLNQNIIWIKFKDNKKKISQEYFEILVYFEDIKEKKNEKKNIIDFLMEEDISEWLKKNYFDLDSDIDKTLPIYNCKIKIIPPPTTTPLPRPTPTRCASSMRSSLRTWPPCRPAAATSRPPWPSPRPRPASTRPLPPPRAPTALWPHLTKWSRRPRRCWTAPTPRQSSTV